jgi:hypothetical protein
MTKLSDLQLILLAAANQREDGQLLPVPKSAGGAGARLEKSISGLLKRSLVGKVGTTAANQVWREEGDQRFGLAITDAGRNVIDPGSGDDAARSPVVTTEPGKPATWRAPSKRHGVIELLKRQHGATLNELTEATGWLPHTMRAALTGLRKQGMIIEKTKRDDVTCYRVGASA